MGNAASLMEARHNARKDIRNERANARAGFYESASEMCGSQNVSGPEIAGPGIGADHAEAAETAATPQGTGGHGAHAPEHLSVASSQAAETAKPVSKQQIAYLFRLGLNRREVCVEMLFLVHIHGSLPRPDEKMCIWSQVMGVLKSMAESIDLRAPMLVIKYATFKEHGCIPRSSDKKTVPLSKLPADIKVRRLFFPLDLLPHMRWPYPPLLVARFPRGTPRLLICARGCWRGAGCVHLAPVASAVVHQGGVREEWPRLGGQGASRRRAGLQAQAHLRRSEEAGGEQGLGPRKGGPVGRLCGSAAGRRGALEGWGCVAARVHYLERCGPHPSSGRGFPGISKHSGHGAWRVSAAAVLFFLGFFCAE